MGFNVATLSQIGKKEKHDDIEKITHCKRRASGEPGFRGIVSSPDAGAETARTQVAGCGPAECTRGIPGWNFAIIIRVAKAYLQKAGDKWGGYRIKGIATMDQTFRTLGVSAESTPNEMQSGDVDEPGMMNNGISSLQTARAEFEKAANDWGGRKQKAIALIDQALKDLQTGIDWAKEHKTY